MSAATFSTGDFRRFLGIALATFILIFAAAWAWVILAPMAYLDREYPIWKAKTVLLGEGKIGNLTILGDSPPNADLIPERLGPSVFNLALGAGTPLETYYQTRRIVTAPAPPQAMVISFTPYHFMVDDFYWAHAAGFDFLNFRELDEVRARSRELHDFTLFEPPAPGDIDVRLKEGLYSIKFPSYYVAALLDARLWGRYRDNSDQMQRVLAERGHTYYALASYSTELDHETTLKSFSPSPLLDDYFHRTLDLLQSHKIPAYFIAMPHNEVSAARYAPGFKEAFAAYLERYAAQYPGFHVLGDVMPARPPRDFGDAWHLNEKGAPEWTDEVAKMMNDAHVEGGPFGPN